MTYPLSWNVGVCSWSLSNDLELLTMLKKKTNISTIHLHIQPELGQQNLDFIGRILEQGWNISSGMVSFEQEDYSTLKTIKKTGGIVPDENWPQNQNKVFNAIDILSKLYVRYLSFHFGFLDIGNSGLIDRVKTLADYANSKKIMLLMETGQETVDELLSFLQKIDHSALAINYDPANMILYGIGKPVESLDKLKEWVKHVHIKDAMPSKQTGQWGNEVRWGQGKVGSDDFIAQLAAINYQGALCIERESGQNRFEDVALAASNVKDFIAKIGKAYFA